MFRHARRFLGEFDGVFGGSRLMAVRDLRARTWWFDGRLVEVDVLEDCAIAENSNWRALCIRS